VIDVSGHGVPSAMLTVALSRSLSAETGYTVQSSMHTVAKQIVSPCEVLRNLDREYPFERFSKFFSISYLVLNCQTGHLRFSSAGHPPPFLIRTDGTVRELDAGGTLIGIGTGVDFEEGAADLEKGDRIFLYTDGIPERANAKGELFGIERLREKLTAIPRAGLASLLDGLMVTLDSFATHQPAADDITICALEFTKKLEANERM
jgi:phosphoserine phosphatase RsbU/P